MEKMRVFILDWRHAWKPLGQLRELVIFFCLCSRWHLALDKFRETTAQHKKYSGMRNFVQAERHGARQ